MRSDNIFLISTSIFISIGYHSQSIAQFDRHHHQKGGSIINPPPVQPPVQQPAQPTGKPPEIRNPQPTSISWKVKRTKKDCGSYFVFVLDQFLYITINAKYGKIVYTDVNSHPSFRSISGYVTKSGSFKANIAFRSYNLKLTGNLKLPTRAGRWVQEFHEGPSCAGALQIYNTNRL